MTAHQIDSEAPMRGMALGRHTCVLCGKPLTQCKAKRIVPRDSEKWNREHLLCRGIVGACFKRWSYYTGRAHVRCNQERSAILGARLNSIYQWTVRNVHPAIRPRAASGGKHRILGRKAKKGSGAWR